MLSHPFPLVSAQHKFRQRYSVSRTIRHYCQLNINFNNSSAFNRHTSITSHHQIRCRMLDACTSCMRTSSACTSGIKQLVTSIVRRRKYSFLVHCITHLTHWGRDEIDAISQTTFPNVFSRMKMYWIRLRFHWNLFPRVQLTIFPHWFR